MQKSRQGGVVSAYADVCNTALSPDFKKWAALSWQTVFFIWQWRWLESAKVSPWWLYIVVDCWLSCTQCSAVLVVDVGTSSSRLTKHVTQAVALIFK